MKALLLMNPSSRGGRGRKLWPELLDALEQRGIQADTRILTSIQEAEVLAAQAEHADVVVAVGGDGTVRAVASGVLNNPNPELPFGVLYTGTSPDFCRTYGIPIDPLAAVETLSQGHIRRLPVILANGRPFFCSSNPGMGAEVARRANRLRPYFGDGLGTFLALAASLLVNRKRTYQLDDGQCFDACNHILFTRIPFIAGGMQIPLPELKDDEIALWYLHDISRLGWLGILMNVYRGRPCGDIRILKCPVALSCLDDSSCPLEYDGDPQGNLPLTLSVSKRKLNLICQNTHA